MKTVATGRPDEKPVPGPKGPRTPYPVDAPPDAGLPGAEPDCVPATPQTPPGRMELYRH